MAVEKLNDLMYTYYKNAITEIKNALRNITEASVDTGVADATSTTTYLDDVSKSWPVNAFEKLIIEITKGTGIDQIRKITSNTATRITTTTAFDTAPDATSEYRISFYGKMASDITHVGGTAQTGRDWSLDFKALTDDSIKGILKSLGDIGVGSNIATILGAIETAVEIIDDWDETNRAAVNLIASQIGVAGGSGGQSALTLRTVSATDSPEVTTIGGTADAAITAGAAGTLSAKLRSLSRDLIANIVLATGANVIGGVTVADGSDTAEGAVADAAVVAGAAGTLSAKLRSISRDLIANIVLATGSNVIGGVTVADGSDVVKGAVADAAVVAGAAGTLSAKLRSISRDLVANIVLATGSNAIGKLAANSGVDIGDVNAPVLETLASSVATTPTQITKTVAAIGTPEALAADGTYFRTATILGKKAARTDNVGNVYIGIGATNDTQPYEIGPGEEKTLNAPPGEKYDLNDWYCDVLNVGDGVIIIYS